MLRFPVSWIALLVLLVSAPAMGAKVEKLTPEQRYELGQRYMKRGYYTKALEQFNRIRNYYRDDPYAVRAELAIADLHYKKAEWDQARLAYEEFQRLHPRNDELDYVVYRVGLCLWKKAPAIAGRDQTWTRQAVNAWSGFEARFPESDLLPDVSRRLQAGRDRLARKEFIIGRFYARRGADRAVIGRMQAMLKTYPQAADRDKALALLGAALANNGDLDEARQALEQLGAIEGSDRLAHELQRHIDSAARLSGVPEN